MNRSYAEQFWKATSVRAKACGAVCNGYKSVMPLRWTIAAIRHSRAWFESKLIRHRPVINVQLCYTF